MSRTCALGVIGEVSDRTCSACGVVVPHEELRFYLRGTPKLQKGTLWSPAPHRARCNRQCSMSNPVPDWKPSDGVHLNLQDCLACAYPRTS